MISRLDSPSASQCLHISLVALVDADARYDHRMQRRIGLTVAPTVGLGRRGRDGACSVKIARLAGRQTWNKRFPHSYSPQWAYGRDSSLKVAWSETDQFWIFGTG